MLPAITILAAPAKIEATVIETPSLSWWRERPSRWLHRLRWTQGLVPLTNCKWIISLYLSDLYLIYPQIMMSNMDKLSTLATKLLTLRNWCGSLPRCRHWAPASQKWSECQQTQLAQSEQWNFKDFLLKKNMVFLRFPKANDFLCSAANTRAKYLLRSAEHRVPDPAGNACTNHTWRCS